MSSTHAPIYVRAHDLARWVAERTRRFPKEQRFVLARRLQDAAFDLLEDATLALELNAGRPARLGRVDEALVRLRVFARLASDLELLTERQVEHLARETAEIGRMVGGWLRHERHSHAGPQ